MTTFIDKNREYERTLEREQARKEGDREYTEWLRETEEAMEDEGG